MKQILIFSLLLFLIASACQQRYGHLAKVRAPKAKVVEVPRDKKHHTIPDAEPEEFVTITADTGTLFVLPENFQKQKLSGERGEVSTIAAPGLAGQKGEEELKLIQPGKFIFTRGGNNLLWVAILVIGIFGLIFYGYYIMLFQSRSEGFGIFLVSAILGVFVLFGFMIGGMINHKNRFSKRPPKGK